MTAAGGEKASWEDWLHGQLLDRRQVLLRGPLDAVTAGRVAAELMLLDASGDGAIRLQVDSGGGPLDIALPLVDTIELLGVPVEATCSGRAEGSALAVFVAAERRLATPHARFRFYEPPTTASGTASDLHSWSEQRRRELQRLADLIAGATGRPLEHVEADIAAGRWLDAAEAATYGLVQEVRRSSPPAGRERPFGFGPGRG